MKTRLKSMVVSASQLAVNALVAVGVGNTAHAVVSAPAVSPAVPTTAAVNQLSLSSIEKSFLAVPTICKARSAAFDPAIVGRETVAEKVIAVHNSLDGAAEVSRA